MSPPIVGEEPQAGSEGAAAEALPAGGLAHAYAAAVTLLAPLVVVAWIAASVAAWQFLPSIDESSASASVSALLPAHPKAFAAQGEELQAFGNTVLTPYLVVQRDPRGLPVRTQARAIARALALDARGRKRPLGRNAAVVEPVYALPIVNALGRFPGAHESGTTAITYLYFGVNAPGTDAYAAAQAYARSLGPAAHVVGVTGALPARVEQDRLINDNLRVVELATVVAILLIVGLAFRSLLAPLLTVLTAAIAFVVSQRLLGWLASVADLTMPRELRPVSVALMLGVVTDYTVFFYAGTRRRLARGLSAREAARATTAEIVAIVFMAGLVVAFGVATLTLGTLGFFRSFGPGMAFTVATGLLVSISLVPALLGLFGRILFWPGLARERAGIPRWRQRAAHLATARPLALLTVIVALALLAAGVSGLPRMALGLSLVPSLPQGNQVQRAGDAAGRGFAPGIVAPTVLLVRGRGVGAELPRLARLQRELEHQRGVAGVLGPATKPLRQRLGLRLAARPSIARYVLVLDDTPSGAPAIATLNRLQDRAPRLLAAAGLRRASPAWAGETAVAAETTSAIDSSVWRIAAAAIAVNLVFLILYLRALVAPLYLVAASGLALAATLGLTAYVFVALLGHGDVTYYIPVAVGALLVSLGSDYNVFVVGRVWQEARRRPLREAIAYATPRAGRAVAVAGVALAASFALLALVPLRPFRVFAFAMAAGVLIDALLVRSVLVPGLIALVGRRGWWPGPQPQLSPPAEPESLQLHDAAAGRGPGDRAERLR